MKNLQFTDLVAKMLSVDQSEILSNCKEIGTVSVSVQIHSILNTSHMVISEPEFLYCTKEEFKSSKYY